MSYEMYRRALANSYGSGQTLLDRLYNSSLPPSTISMDDLSKTFKDELQQSIDEWLNDSIT